MKLIITTLLFLITLTSAGQETITIRVSTPNKTDEVFIAGNQASLGDWNPSKVKMNKISDFERELTVSVSFPAEYKFTRGNWESQGIIKNLSNNPNLVIKDKNSQNTFVIKNWSDEIKEDEMCLRYDIKKYNSKILNEERVLKIALPDNYDKNNKYPVIYITDANTKNFSIALSYISQLMNSNSIPKVILVGINQKKRWEELDVFWSDKGKKFKDYLFEEVIPYINSNYYTSGFNTIIGHSDGAEYNHLLMLEKNNPFRGFINISTNLNNDVSEEIEEFFKTNIEKTLYYFISNAKYDSGDRVLAGNQIDSLYNISKNKNIRFTKEDYTADHQNLVSKSMLNGISFVFQDYRNLDNYKRIKEYAENYQSEIEDFYGFKPEFEENDFGFYFSKIMDEKNLQDYEYWVNFGKENNFLFGSSLDRANHYFELEEYDHTIKFWEKAVNEFENIYPRSYLANFPKAISAYLFEKNPFGAIEFLEKSIKRLPEFSLEFNYFIAKTSIENNVKLKKGREALRFCKLNYKKNRYFSMKELKELERE
ncbi:alpha/beta hydrolase-fold protein [Yeosuana marina]|uniref:alpha/beta hydrolase-fold protein n=1 Tax=Yeosuana marina TaxID=1565536 RepID=UPI00141F0151|nr:alpha/beta hydrolase-fold protein [Yeosuana marina]